jgi:hypothetical protein
VQINPRKTKEISLHFLGFLWPILGFSTGYGESKSKKFLPPWFALEVVFEPASAHPTT